MRQRLALLVAAAMALVLVAFVVPLAWLVRTAVADRAVAAATAQANSLSALVATAQPGDLRLSVDQLNASSAYPVTVFLADGTVLGPAAERGPSVQLAQLGRSFTAEAPGGREILVAVQGATTGTSVIRSFVTDAELHRGVARAWTALALLGLVLLVIGVVVADRLVGTVVRPIGEVAGVSRRLAAGDLDARAGEAGPPEVRALAGSLNHLGGRIRDLIWQEREAVADLSHRLRTPLTALRLEVEAVPDGQLRDRLGRHVGALTGAVTGLIEDARRRGQAPASCDAVAVVAQRVAFWAALAEDEQRQLSVSTVAGPLPVAVSAADLGACLDALLGNVFAHTPAGADFSVGLAARPGGGARLTVRDSGPGFASPALVGRGVSAAGSSGLGLDIARQTAEASGGALRVEPTSGGASVVVELGPPRLADR